MKSFELFFIFLAVFFILGLVLLLRKLISSRQEILFLKKEKDFLDYQLQEQKKIFEDRLSFAQTTRLELEKNLKDLCHQSLVQAQSSFVSFMKPFANQMQEQTLSQMAHHTETLAHVTKPFEDSLSKMMEIVQHLEVQRSGAYEGLKEQVKNLLEAQKILKDETQHLVTALRTPHIRGCWGEMQLKRVIELSGMSKYCDFQEQMTLVDTKQNKKRPDVVIHFSNEQKIFVDAKAPILYYIEACQAEDKNKYQEKLKEHARLLMHHIKDLSQKEYWKYDAHTAEFVILFLPGEAFLSAALEADVSLVEFAAERQIILATPITLIALLKTIAQGWRHQKLSEQTQKIVTLSKQLYENLQKFDQHFKALGKHLKAAHSLYHKNEKLFEEDVTEIMKDLSSTGLSLDSLEEKKSFDKITLSV